MRYEHIELDISTAACSDLLNALQEYAAPPWGYSVNAIANQELHGLVNELMARLQRTDVDAQCPKNLEPAQPDNLDLIG